MSEVHNPRAGVFVFGVHDRKQSLTPMPKTGGVGKGTKAGVSCRGKTTLHNLQTER